MEALGLRSAKGTLPRVLREARKQGYLAPGTSGRVGYLPGPVEAPPGEPEKTAEAA